MLRSKAARGGADDEIIDRRGNYGMSVYSPLHSGHPHSVSSGAPSARLLLAAPVAAVALAMRDILLAAGHEVVGPARSPGEALDLAAHHRPDLAIVDLLFSGHLAARHVAVNLARRLPQDCQAPSLFIAAEPGRLRTQKEGAGCLEKPTTAELLVVAVAAALQLLRRDVLSPSLPPQLRLWRRQPSRSLAA